MGEDVENRAPADLKNLKQAFPKADEAKLRKLVDDLKAALKADDENVDDIMDEANEILDGHGVEAVQGDERVSAFWQRTILLYVNLGDTYDTTLCYSTEDNEFFVGSWGDFVEAWEAEGDEDEDEDDKEEDEEEEEEEDDDEDEGEDEDADLEETGGLESTEE
jgi:hypothetical protein